MRLIDADALEEDMCNLWMQNEISNGDWIGFRELLNSQETVVEFDGDINKVVVKAVEYFPQKTGHWIDKSRGEQMNSECSECHTLFRVLNYDYQYCPVCGSRNVGEEE